MESIRFEGRRSPMPGWWISFVARCHLVRVKEETSLALRTSYGVEEELAEPRTRERTEVITAWGSFCTTRSYLVLDSTTREVRKVDSTWWNHRGGSAVQNSGSLAATRLRDSVGTTTGTESSMSDMAAKASRTAGSPGLEARS